MISPAVSLLLCSVILFACPTNGKNLLHVRTEATEVSRTRTWVKWLLGCSFGSTGPFDREYPELLEPHASNSLALPHVCCGMSLFPYPWIQVKSLLLRFNLVPSYSFLSTATSHLDISHVLIIHLPTWALARSHAILCGNSSELFI